MVQGLRDFIFYVLLFFPIFFISKFLLYCFEKFRIDPNKFTKFISKINFYSFKMLKKSKSNFLLHSFNLTPSLLEEWQLEYFNLTTSTNSSGQLLIDSKESDKLFKDAVLDVVHIPGIVEELKEKGGQVIIDHLLERIEKGATGKGAAEAHRKIAEVAYRIGNIEQAKKSLNIILANKNNDLYAINSLGNVYDLQGRLQDAKTQYQKLIDLAPDNKNYHAIAYGNMGNIYQTQGKLDKAMKMYKEALTINKKLGRKEGIANQYGNMGIIYQTQGKLDKAMEMYKEALTINKELGRKEGIAAVYGNMGIVYKTQGKPDKAKEVWQKSLTLFQELGNKSMVEKVQKMLDTLNQEDV